MVMAAGLGTRLRPLTYHLPKPLIPVVNLPLMHHLLLLIRRHGIAAIGTNVSYMPEAMQEYFGDGSALGLKIHWSVEEELVGTAGGTKALSPAASGCASQASRSRPACGSRTAARST
jgi:NDP-sugar pyrophosphorylase family protein